MGIFPGLVSVYLFFVFPVENFSFGVTGIQMHGVFVSV